ncbi:hypothetical protein Scel_58430 [Streptomyces cellostaticus]|nr:hypothetical protein Scel_58430 [Streptomyces cellostaticus]
MGEPANLLKLGKKDGWSGAGILDPGLLRTLGHAASASASASAGARCCWEWAAALRRGTHCS